MGLKHHVNKTVSAHSQFHFFSEFKNLSIVYVLTNHTNHTNLSSEKKLEAKSTFVTKQENCYQQF